MFVFPPPALYGSYEGIRIPVYQGFQTYSSVAQVQCGGFRHDLSEGQRDLLWWEVEEERTRIGTTVIHRLGLRAIGQGALEQGFFFFFFSGDHEGGCNHMPYFVWVLSIPAKVPVVMMLAMAAVFAL